MVTFAIIATFHHIFCREDHRRIEHCQNSIQQCVIKIRMVKSLTTTKSETHVIDSNYQIQTKPGG
jgi:hypothetical protein